MVAFTLKASLAACLLAISICNAFHLSLDVNLDVKRLEDDSLGNNTYCFWTSYLLACSNFTDLNDLELDKSYNFTSLTLSEIRLEPGEKIVFFSETAAFKNVKLQPQATVLLKNFKGFEIFGNPFANANTTGLKFIIQNSYFDLYEEGHIIDSQRCDEINKDDLYVAFLDDVSELHLSSGIRYSLNMCPAVLKNAKMDRFEISYLGKNGGQFSYIPIDTSIPQANLNCIINEYIVRDSSVALNTSLLNPDVLQSTEKLNIIASEVTSVQENLFKDNFINLNLLELDLLNLQEITDNPQADNRWMKHLNNKYNETKKQFDLLLMDNNNQAAFFEESFCLFKDFPHENFVFPIIYAKPLLNCTCTLLWLLKNYKYHRGPLDMSTTSTENCVDSADFDNMLAACDFETRIANCSDTPKTTTPIQTTTPVDNSTIIGNTTYCVWSMELLECTDFPNLDELGLTKSLGLELMNFNKLRLVPKIKIVFESSSYAFRYVGLAEDCEIVLENFKGFEMTGNAFLLQNVRKTLVIKHSSFDLYRNEMKISARECDDLNTNGVFVPIFENINKVLVAEDVSYSSDFCPAAFKHARLETVSLENVSNSGASEGFSFVHVDTYLPSSNLDSKIENFTIDRSIISMDTSLLNPDLLLNTKSISIKGSTVVNINNNLFDKKFIYLEYLEIEAYSLAQLLIEDKAEYPNSDNRWLAHLNHNYNETNKQFDLVLTDLFNATQFPDESFCSLIKFPHQNFVFPIITTVADLNCTCPLIWLLKNRDYYTGQNDMRTISTAKCLDDPNFDDYIAGCNFTERIETCYKYTTIPDSTTTVSTVTTTTSKVTTTAFDPYAELDRVKSALVDYKITAVFFILFTILFLGLIIFIFIFPKYMLKLRRTKMDQLKEEINFVNID